MYNKNGCGQGRGLSIGAWHVGAVIMVPETISKKLRPMPIMAMSTRLHAVSAMWSRPFDNQPRPLYNRPRPVKKTDLCFARACNA